MRERGGCTEQQLALDCVVGREGGGGGGGGTPRQGEGSQRVYFFLAPGEKNDIMLAVPFASAALGPFFGVSFAFFADFSSTSAEGGGAGAAAASTLSLKSASLIENKAHTLT
jgi:hypothetical protein